MRVITDLRHVVGTHLSRVWQVTKRTCIDVNDNELLTRASAIAFTAMMAAVPFLALVVAIAALVMPAAGIDARQLLTTLEALLGTVFPPDAYRVIEEQILRLQEAKPIAVLSISAVVTLWLASGLLASVIDGLNRIYGVVDTRSWWRFRLTAIWMTIVQSLFMLIAVGLIFAFPLAVDWVGLTIPSPWVATAVTWLIIFLMLLASFALTFGAGPDVEQAHKWVTPGAIFGAVVFMASTYGFRVYVQHLAQYDITYGSLGGVMMLMFWFYLSSLVLLVAGEVNKICHYARQWSGSALVEAASGKDGSADRDGNAGKDGGEASSAGPATDTAGRANISGPATKAVRATDTGGHAGKAGQASKAGRASKAGHTNWRFCPQCASPLAVREENGEPVLACTGDGCQFIDWNNPVPVVAALIVAPARAESGPSTSAVSGSGDRVVLVKRGVEPFVGRWCLPRGFLKTDENPKGAVVREVEEETGLRILLKRMLNACNPSPANYPLNQITMFYLATIAGGVLGSGDDAAEVGLFGRDELPDICFDSDTQLIADWFAGVHGQVEAPVNYAPPSSSSQVVSVIPATGCGSKS